MSKELLTQAEPAGAATDRLDTEVDNGLPALVPILPPVEVRLNVPVETLETSVIEPREDNDTAVVPETVVAREMAPAVASRDTVPADIAALFVKVVALDATRLYAPDALLV